METVHQFQTTQTVNDKRCFIYFEKVSEAKVNITLGITPNFRTAINAIKYIESESDHLKHFIGFKRAKRLIFEEYQDLHEE